MRKSIFTIFVTVSLLVTLSSMHSGLLSRNKYEPCSENQYQGNMLMIAQVMEGDDVLLNCEVAVFDSNEECRASEMSIPNDNGYVYLTIQGEGEGEPLHFRVVYESGDSIRDVLADETIMFVNDDVVGSLQNPFVINIDKPVSVDDIKADKNDVDILSTNDGILIRTMKRQSVSVYNIMGVCMFQQEVEGECVVNLPQGIYIANGKKIIVK